MKILPDHLICALAVGFLAYAAYRASASESFLFNQLRLWMAVLVIAGATFGMLFLVAKLGAEQTTIAVSGCRALAVGAVAGVCLLLLAMNRSLTALTRMSQWLLKASFRGG
jgi:hypothetical protein